MPPESKTHELPLMVELVIISEPPELFNIPPPYGSDLRVWCAETNRGIVTDRTTRDGHGAILVDHTSSRATECRLIT